MMKKMDVRMPGTGPGTWEVSNECRKVCAEPFTGIHSLPLFCLVLPHSLHMPRFLFQVPRLFLKTLPQEASMFTDFCLLYPLNLSFRTSLALLWLRICLLVQGTQVWSLVWEDSTCLGAKSVQPSYWAHAPRARALQQEKPPQREARTLQGRVAPSCCN